MAIPHAARLEPLPAALELVELRLPRALSRALRTDRCALRDRQSRARSEHDDPNDRGELTSPLIVDALGWRRVLGAGANVQPPEAAISRGLEVHPHGASTDLDVWIDRSLIRHGYAWSVPAGAEQRVGVGSYEPRDHVKEPTQEIAHRLGRDAVRYQGNWFPHKLRPAGEDGVFFVGDSAGHCLPLSGEGIRTAFYFGIAAGREIKAAFSGVKRRSRRWTPTAPSRTVTRPRSPPRSRSNGSSAPAAARPDRAAERDGPRAPVPARLRLVPGRGASGDGRAVRLDFPAHRWSLPVQTCVSTTAASCRASFRIGAPARSSRSLT